MKFNKTNTILIVILLVLIVLTISNSCVSFKPTYSNTKMGFSKYEGFGNREGMGGVIGGSTVNSPPASATSLLNAIKQITPSSSSASTVKESFTNIQSSTYGTDTPLDPFSGTPGKIECDGGSSGLHNSMGGLCLSDTQKKLLQTRGGNATGGGFQIGE